MIIWIASYPRSGNTFFRLLLNHIYDIKTYSIYNDPLFDKLKGSSEIIGHKKMDLSYEHLMESEQVFFVKTHDLPKDSSPSIYLVRDGRDSVTSYAHYIKSFESNQNNWFQKIKTILGKDEYSDILEKLIISSESNYGSWSNNVSQWKNRSHLTTVLRFEDLIKNPIECTINSITSMAKFGTGSFEPRSNLIPTFQDLHSKWPDFFRKGQNGSGKKEMNQSLQKLFWKYHGSVMQELGYLA